MCVRVLTELVDRLKQQRKPSGATESIGPALVEWVCYFSFFGVWTNFNKLKTRDCGRASSAECITQKKSRCRTAVLIKIEMNVSDSMEGSQLSFTITGGVP